MKNTILIVDDELNICNLILQLVPWKELNLEVIGTARNGLQAYDIITQKQPAIIITDIKMPGMDGLELIKKTVDAGIPSNFIIISGYKDFEYAHSAIKYNVKDYLVKPINKDNLVGALKNICRQLELDSNQTQEIQKTIEYSHIAIGQQRKKFITDLIYNSIQLEQFNKPTIEKEYHYHFSMEKYFMAVIHFDYSSSLNKYADILIPQFSEILSNELSISCTEHEYTIYKDELVFLVNFAEKNASLLKRSIGYIFDSIYRTTNLKQNEYHVTIGIGLTCSSINELRKSFFSANNAIKSRLVLGIDQIIYASDIAVFPDNHKNAMSRSIENLFQNDAVLSDKDACIAEALSTFREYLKKYNDYPSVAPDIVQLIIDGIFKALLDRISVESNLNTVKKKAQKGFHFCCTVSDLENYMSNVISAFFDDYLANSNKKDMQIINTVQHYIKNNFQNRIELTDLAKEVYLSPAYLGILFKQLCGLTFSEYLTEVRMKAAKSFLKDFKHSVSDVARLSGYKDAKYFSRQFKKYENVYPAEYRKLLKFGVMQNEDKTID